MTHGKLEWFGGNKTALAMYRLLVELAHIWDDMIDDPQNVSEERKCRALFIALVELPANTFYAQIQGQLLPFWVSVLSAYTTANHFEVTHDEHGLEIAHGLRYAAGHIVAYMVYICVGPQAARLVMPDVWKTMMPERLDDYRKEHSNVQKVFTAVH